MSKNTIPEIEKRLKIISNKFNTIDYQIEDPELLEAFEFAIEGLDAVRLIAFDLAAYDEPHHFKSSDKLIECVREHIYELTITGPNYECGPEEKKVMEEIYNDSIWM